MTANEVAIRLHAKDQMSPFLERAQQQMRAMQPAAEQAARGLNALPGAARAAQQALGGLVSGLGALGLAATGVQALAGALGGLGGALGLELASDASEASSKITVVLGQAGEQLATFAATSAQAFGLSRLEALQTTGMFGNLFKTMGLGEDAAARMSVDITKLGADLASFHNIAGSDALEKLRAGLVGESEPLRALGVLLTEDAVKAKAMQLGLAGANGALSEAAKVQARYALILEQTKDAQNDFARTSTGLANSQRIIRASFKDMQTQIGERLLPVLAPLVAQFAQALPGALRAAQSFLDRFGQVVGSLGQWLAGPGLDGVKTFIGALSGAWQPAPGIQQFHLIVGSLGKIIQTVRDGVLTFIGAISGTWQPAPGITDFHRLIGEIGLFIRERVVPAIRTFADIARKAFSGDIAGALTGMLGLFATTSTGLTETLAGWGKAFLAWVAPLIPPFLTEVGKIAATIFTWAQERAPELLAKLQAWGQALLAWVQPMIPPLLAEAGKMAQQLLGWIGEQAPPLLKALLTEWLPSFINWLLQAAIDIGPKLGAFLATTLDWLIAHGPDLARTFLGEWVPAAIGWLVEAGVKIAPKLWEFLTGIDTWMKTVGGPKLAEFAAKLGVAIAQGIYDGLLKMDTWLREKARELAWGVLNDAKKALGISSELTVGVGAPGRDSRAGGQPEARAHGGPVLPGRAYLVGERGPELFRPRLAGAIIPNRQLSAGGGGLTINGPLIGAVTVTGAADEERLAATIERVLAERWQAAAAQGVRAPLGVTRMA